MKFKLNGWKGEGPRVFLWYESTSQVEGKILSDNCKIDDVVWEKVLGCQEPRRE